MRLSDTIEAFIKTMMAQDAHEVELKRNELAEYFHCAPSQINYVLSTRFTPDHGYVIESQRGGGGFIRIVRIQRGADEQLNYLLRERIGDSIDEQSAQILCTQLSERGAITGEDANLMVSALSSRAICMPLPEEMKNQLRARILRNMLLCVAQRPETK